MRCPLTPLNFVVLFLYINYVFAVNLLSYVYSLRSLNISETTISVKQRRGEEATRSTYHVLG